MQTSREAVCGPGGEWDPVGTHGNSWDKESHATQRCGPCQGRGLLLRDALASWLCNQKACGKHQGTFGPGWTQEAGQALAKGTV